MSESIAIHSNEQLEYLLEKTIVEDSKNNTSTSSRSEDDSNMRSKKFDMLTLGEGHDPDIESHYNHRDNKSKGLMQNSNEANTEKPSGEIVRSYVMDSLDVEELKNTQLDELKEQYRKMEEAYSEFENSALTDSLDLKNTEEEVKDIHNEFLDTLESNKKDIIETPVYIDGNANSKINSDYHDELFLNDEEMPFNVDTKAAMLEAHNEEQSAIKDIPKRKGSNMKPRFRYREPMPVFITKNKIQIGKRSQGSYTEKFKSEKKIVEKKAKGFEGSKVNIDSKKPKKWEQNLQHQDALDYLEKSSQNNHNEMEQFGNVGHTNGTHFNSGCADNQSNFTHQNVLPDLMHLRENVEISRLNDMIKEEEKSLKDHIFDPPLKQEHPGTYQQTADYHHMPIMIDSKFHGLTSKPIGQTFSDDGCSTRKEEHLKISSYAERHSLISDKQKPIVAETVKSYAAQHEEKKYKPVYKKYSLKDYKALNFEVKLQKSLGPDKSSEEYLEKKARADRLKDYASSVADHNRRSLLPKKVKSAPAPTVKDRLKESKRLAALEYSKNVKNTSTSRKPSKVFSRQRPSSERREQVSVLEIMKQRHEAEKLAVDKVRQDLADMIKTKEVKS